MHFGAKCICQAALKIYNKKPFTCTGTWGSVLMSRRNIVVSIICALLCCTGVTVIFERYQSWTNQAFDELAAENIKAYSDSQNTEVTARVENVRTTLKTIAEMIRQREEAGEGTEGLEEYFDAVSSNEDIQAKGVYYYRFDTLDIADMGARDPDGDRRQYGQSRSFERKYRGKETAYNDWIILNVFHSKEMNKYVLTLEDNGKKMTALLIGLAAVTVLLVAGIVYHGNKEHRFERIRTALLTNFSDMILCEYDRNKDVLRCTSNISRVLAVEQTQITDFKQFIADSGLVHPQDHLVLEDMIKRHLKEGETEKYEVRLKAKGNAYIWCRLDIVSIGSKRKRILVIKVTDISGEKKKEMALMRKAQRDTLSGLLNRGAFKDQVSEYIRQSQGGCLFLIDLDNFKDINDRYGHLAGDESIRKVGEVLRACFSARDVIGRYGGDDFFAFVPAG